MAQNTQTTAAGGALTQQQVADLLLQPLQAKSVFLAAGPRIFDTDGGNNLRIPKLVSSTGATFVAEGATIPDDDTTFGEITLLPKTMQAVKVITKVSDELLRQSIVALDQVLKDRLVTDIAAALDNAFINGTGTTQPLGMLAAAGTQSIVVTGAATTDLLYDMSAKLLTANVDPTGARWLITPYVFNVLRKTKASGTGDYMIQPDLTAAGKFQLLGWPVDVTSRIPTGGSATYYSKIVLWVPSLYAVARDIAPEVKVLTERYADTGQVGIRVQARYDAAPLYPEAVVIATNVTGGP